MNPFELSGPEFLAFYAVYGLVVLGLLFVSRHGGEPEDAARISITNPYSIAFLRGGRNEALRVATVSLIDRGLLQVEGSRLQTRDAEDVKRVKDGLEKAVLTSFERQDEAVALFEDGFAGNAADEVGRALERLGLVAGETTTPDRRRRFLRAAMALWAVAIVKMGIGVYRNRPVTFLFVLACIFTVLAWLLHNPRRTRRGNALLEDMRTLFRRLKERAEELRPTKDATEATLLAAVFGLTMLPEAGWLHLRSLYPKATSSAGSSSGGSSCGSSCGGGGCGGGCGGCGG
jgi:uncharacterized protein (TIGR04222 family)